MGQPVYKFLEDFGGDATQNAAAQWASRVVEPPAQKEPPPPPTDRAYEKGLEDGMAASRTMLEVEIARIRGEADRSLEAAKADFSKSIANSLAEDLQRQIAELQTSLADQLAVALTPVLRHVLTDATIDQIASEMRALVDGRQAVSVELHGPQELVDEVMRKHEELSRSENRAHAPEVRVVYTDTLEIRLAVDDTLVETRMMEWIGKVAEATG